MRKILPKKHAKTLSLFELMQHYPTEESAYQYFEQNRWGNEPVCQKCGCTGRITKQKHYKKGYWCGDCKSYFNAFTNTPLERNRGREARKWVFAAYLPMTSPARVSQALQMSKELDVRALHSVLERDEARTAGLIIMEPLSDRKFKNYHKTMAEAGDLKIRGRMFARMQILTAQEILEGKRFDTPLPRG